MPSRLRKVLVGLALAPVVLAAILVLAMAVFGFLVDTTCDGDDPDALQARSLPKKRYAEIFNFVRARAPWPENRFETEIPPELQDLGLSVIRTYSDPGVVVLRIRGCLDHHLDLNVIGADAPVDGGPRIELRYGEWEPGREVLWKPPAKVDS